MTILNLNKEYKKQPLMFGSEGGLYDSIHIDNSIFDVHKRGVSQFWQADEFSFSSCKPEFEQDDDGKHIMVETLKTQWLMDSAACNLYTLLQPFISNDQLTQLILFNTYLESVHSETYSEIVKNAFPNPQKTIEEASQQEDIVERASKVIEVFSILRQAGLDYSTGKRKLDKSLLADVYKGVVALYLMERLQFIASFAITFALGEMGRFIPVVQAVRKICADETIIHAETDVLILEDLKRNELWDKVNTEEFQKEIQDLVEEVVSKESIWTDNLFKDRSLPGITPEAIKEWVQFNSNVVRKTLGLDIDKRYKKNPLPWIEGYLSSNTYQSAPQEVELGQYLVGGLTDDLDTLDNVDLDF